MINNRKKLVLDHLNTLGKAVTAKEIAAALSLDRTNISRYLNELHKENQIKKIPGRPVLYQAISLQEGKQEGNDEKAFSRLIGYEASLKEMVQQAKAAILYPPNGLHTIIFGQTGTGKSLFAECMYEYALEARVLAKDAPFITYNCADYAQNPQLLFGHIFGVKKGSYTGASQDRTGLIHEANNGILFLDEIHRLPPEGQEMLFTFIDKGIYRPLGESNETYHANVLIIGATTEKPDVMLSTFTRRIPMTITLPDLVERTVEERYELVDSFLKQEAQRLNQKITIKREVLLAFMLYQPEGNIGQFQRDLKLVCAKAYLNFKTEKSQSLKSLKIDQKDLPFQVQKGLLSIKEMPKQMERLIQQDKAEFTYMPTSEPTENLANQLNKTAIDPLMAKNLIKKTNENLLETYHLEGSDHKEQKSYFNEYVKTLSTTSDIRKHIIDPVLKELVEKMYLVAKEQLQRTYSAKIEFAFALHLQSALERIKEKQPIDISNLNAIRKNYPKEFQVAIDLSAMVEETYSVDVPFEEIGFIALFLTKQEEAEMSQKQEKTTSVMVLMHGKTTASSMMETVQELLETTVGIAINMPLTMKVQDMYKQVRQTILKDKERYQQGLLILTDMGSLNTFGNMLAEDLGLRIKSLPMVSTPVVLEAVRMASIGRTLEDIYQSCQTVLKSSTKQLTLVDVKKMKAVLVTCFTGEGVAKKLEERIKPVLDSTKVTIIPLQFLHREAFKQQIDQLMESYDIKAIVGTVEFDYQNIPFYTAYDVFNDEKLLLLKTQIEEELPINEMIQSLTGTLKKVGSIQQLMYFLQKLMQQLKKELNIMIPAGVETGIILHVAFLIEGLKTGTIVREFSELEEYAKKNRMMMDVVKATLIPLEKQYQLIIPEDEIAYITQMIIENKVKMN
ncbi:Transcriptional regulatory protein LevR, contains PRD, AAA+ and EIIA domains [Carnobacterium alterfunditum]|uniref:DNA translocase FtsK n=1 Tax=Carnobacterium alterfunditum TaxID=28230 RepID=A0A1N6I2E7_9LACT|nr:sigma-54-dependent transcriptional regulator [Carnobacterium alterfunditum]SIO26171.1 Transcriptional regulatory protein LevR, contains PRD, AAA+ and EIIA domains [Carnobacterium alterfunditum]